MKPPRLLTLLALGTFLTLRVSAGTLFYVPVPPTQTDTSAGIDSVLAYTSAIAAGPAKEPTRMINGVTFHTMIGAENTVTVNNVTLSAATGSLNNGGGKSESIKAEGAFGDVLGGMIFNEGATDDSEQYIVLDTASLTAGRTYDLRVYVCNSSSQNREVNLTFAGDGKAEVSTDFFNQDDATTSPGGFADPNQVYYITYRYTWDGITTPGVTVTQRFGATPFCLYALTNHEVAGGDSATTPLDAILAAEPVASPVAPPVRAVRTNLVVDKGPSDDVGVASEVFYEADSLRSNGRWVDVAGYGRCWRPTRVDAGWSPYTRGRWVHSHNDGWVWNSDEEWGWATYHYGRWFREEGSGWYWVPGRVWAPSWVSWRYGRGHVGWAPLPPVATFSVSFGIGRWADTRWGIGPQHYNFVNVRDFGAHSMGNVIVPRQQNVTIVRNTTNITNIVNNRNVIYNGGPNVTTVNNIINRTGGQQVQTVRVDRKQGAKALTPDGKRSQLQAGVLAVAAPTVVPQKGKVKPPKTDAPPIKDPKIDQGWSGVSDPALKTSLASKMASELQSAAAKTAPARLPGVPPAKPVLTSKPAVPGVKEPEVPGKAPVEPGVKTGGPKATGLEKPGAPVKPPVESVTPPTQPDAPKVTGIKKPGVLVKPPVESVTPPTQPDAPKVTGIKKPGAPVKPPVESVTPPTQPDAPKVTGIKKPGVPVKPSVESVTPPTQPDAPKVTGIKKPGAPVKPPVESVTPPAQPDAPKVTGIKKPGAPVQPAAESVTPPTQPDAPKATGIKKPGVPAKPPVESVTPPTQPAEPKTPVAKKPGSKAKSSGETVVPPDHPVQPTVKKPVTPERPPNKPAVQPETPTKPTEPGGKKLGKKGTPVDEPVQKPRVEPTPGPVRTQPDAVEPKPKSKAKHPVEVAPKPVRAPNPPPATVKPNAPVKRPQPTAPAIKRPIQPAVNPVTRPAQSMRIPPPAARPSTIPPKGQPVPQTPDEEKSRKKKT